MKKSELRVLAIIFLTVALSGCGGAIDGCTLGGVAITVDTVDDPPPNAPVTNSTQIQDVRVNGTSLRATQSGTTFGDILTRVAETDERADFALDGRAVCRIGDAFTDVPRHDGDRFGYYFQHDGAVLRVTLLYET